MGENFYYVPIILANDIKHDFYNIYNFLKFALLWLLSQIYFLIINKTLTWNSIFSWAGSQKCSCNHIYVVKLIT